MNIISDDQIASLGISPKQCVDWVKMSFLSKPEADMPTKISVHPVADSFFTAMPCYHPEIGRVGVKVISRVPGGNPSLKSKMMLFDPVHVRGFQDCDLTFDKVFGDDARHMSDWKNFGHYRHFAEFSDVLLGKVEGRASQDERIISYNYGLGLHDLWFASRILDNLGIVKEKRGGL